MIFHPIEIEKATITKRLTQKKNRSIDSDNPMYTLDLVLYSKSLRMFLFLFGRSWRSQHGVLHRSIFAIAANRSPISIKQVYFLIKCFFLEIDLPFWKMETPARDGHLRDKHFTYDRQPHLRKIRLQLSFAMPYFFIWRKLGMDRFFLHFVMFCSSLSKIYSFA